MHLHPASMHSFNKRGLSAVRPEMSATRGWDGDGSSATEVRKAGVDTYEEEASEEREEAQALNSGPPGPSAPGPRNHGSMT
mmetsp:Transcript_5421/g.11325  ORF Transcript_5421/g.11325 Transcript_5421/m.11325 type:complete len:81 (-) Transcript_5421:159-401(-)